MYGVMMENREGASLTAREAEREGSEYMPRSWGWYSWQECGKRDVVRR